MLILKNAGKINVLFSHDFSSDRLCRDLSGQSTCNMHLKRDSRRAECIRRLNLTMQISWFNWGIEGGTSNAGALAVVGHLHLGKKNFQDVNL
jgi:hypothetical protein